MSHRLGATVLFTALVLSACSRPHPNVLVITMDTTRADHLGCYGMPLARTPNIDKVAAEGVRCTNAVSAAPITMPSHTSIFTGLLPPAHGVRDNGAYALGDDAVTLAERLRDAGYTTHAFVSAIVLSRRYNLSQGFETYDDDLWTQDQPPLFMIRERRAPDTAAKFLRWFDGWAKAKEKKPFFTWIHFFDPHQPYHPSRADIVMSVSQYDAEIAGVDREIGRIIKALGDKGQLDNTLVIITADHGESLGEHGEKTHAIFVYDATVHVPLIVRYPRLFPPKVYDAPVRSVDITPTVLSILGLKEQATDGQDLSAALGGRAAAPQNPQYSESMMTEVGFGMAPLFAVRDGGYKFVRAPRPELYDLRADPRELHNILAAQPRIGQRLQTELATIEAASKRHAVRAAANPMTKETEESLQALGYLAPRGERESMQGMDPKDALPLHNKLENARHFAQQGRWSDAQKLLDEIVAVTPRNVSAINIQGLVALRSGNAPEAIRCYERSLAIDRQQFRVHAVLGTIAMTAGDFDRATAETKVALGINPHFVEAMVNLGFIESMRGNDKEAEAWYQKGIAADPSFPRVYRRLADLYYERKDFARAYDYYMRVTKLAPTDSRATLQAGTSARRLGRFAEADALFARAEKLYPDGWVPTYNRACLMATSGKPKEALATLAALNTRHRLPADLVETDTDLTSVRALPGYAALKKNLARGDDAEEVAAEDAG